jgi:hypothetical protein
VRTALDFFAAALMEPTKIGPDVHRIIPENLFTAIHVWRGQSQRLPDEFLTRLLGAKSLWLRAYVGAIFGNRLPKEWIVRLESDLRVRVAPLSEKQVKEWTHHAWKLLLFLTRTIRQRWSG